MNGAMGDGVRGELTDRFVCAVDHLSRLMQNERLGELKKLGLNSHQANTLMTLYYLGPTRMGALANHLGSKLPHMSIIVDHLVGKGYLQRSSDPSDRRVVICEFTDDGRRATQRIMKHTRIRAKKVAEIWDFKQFESVVESLESLWSTDEVRSVRIVSDENKDRLFNKT